MSPAAIRGARIERHVESRNETRSRDLVVEQPREIRFRHPDAPQLHGAGDGRRRKHRENSILAVTGLDSIEKATQGPTKRLKLGGSLKEVVVRCLDRDRPGG